MEHQTRPETGLDLDLASSDIIRARED